MLKTIPPSLKPYYKNKVNEYFNQIDEWYHDDTNIFNNAEYRFSFRSREYLFGRKTSG